MGRDGKPLSELELDPTRSGDLSFTELHKLGLARLTGDNVNDGQVNDSSPQPTTANKSLPQGQRRPPVGHRLGNLVSRLQPPTQGARCLVD